MIMGQVDISGLDKAEVLYGLYNGSHCQGMSFMGAVDHYTLDDARADYEASPDKYFDYLHGHVLKVHLDGDTFDSWGYDRDCGEGAAQVVIDGLRKKKGMLPKRDKESVRVDAMKDISTDAETEMQADFGE